VSTISFAGFAPPVPAGRVFDLYEMLPQQNRDEDEAGSGDLLRFCSIMQEAVDLLLVDVDRFPEIADPDIAPEQFVDAMLDDLGNPFDFAAALALVDKRRLVETLLAIYQEKGSNVGMVNAVRFFMGLTITIDEVGFGTWQLGVPGLSTLGSNCGLGSGDPFTLNSFDVVCTTTLSDAQLAQVIEICTYMKWAPTHLRNVVQPFTPPTPTPWQLGVFGESRLGVNSILHA
jgi:phage tail-like protein